jgi:hypothetical protein
LAVIVFLERLKIFIFYNEASVLVCNNRSQSEFHATFAKDLNLNRRYVYRQGIPNPQAANKQLREALEQQRTFPSPEPCH